MSRVTVQGSMRVEPLACSLGAELSNLNLGDAAHDAGLFAEIKALLLQYKVLFLRDQHFSRAEHVAFARRFGELEDHPVVGSDPEHPGLVQIYKGADSRHLQYENAWHCDATWRECPQMGAVLRCVECPPVGGGARRFCSSTRSPRTSRISTRPPTCVSARTTRRVPRSCCTT